jgi:hypothetical protein
MKICTKTLSMLHKVFQHFVDDYYTPLQDTIFPTSSRTPKTPCKCPAAQFTRDLSISIPRYVFQVRTSEDSVCSPLHTQTVPIQSPILDEHPSPPPLESVTHSSINSSHNPSILSSSPLPIHPPGEIYLTAQSYWSPGSDSQLSKEAGQDGNPDDSEEVGEELWEGFGTQGIRRGSV